MMNIFRAIDFLLQPVPPYLRAFLRLYVAASGILIGIWGLNTLDQLKFVEPDTELQSIRQQYITQTIASELAALKEKFKSPEDVGKQKIELEQLIAKLEIQPHVPPPDWQGRLNRGGSTLSYAYDLGVAGCIALITICSLYLLYSLAAWLQVPADKVELIKIDSAGKTATEAVKAAAAGKAAVVGIAGLLTLAPTMLAAAGIFSAVIVIQHVDGKDGKDGKNGKEARDGQQGQQGQPGQRGGDGKDATAGNPPKSDQRSMVSIAVSTPSGPQQLTIHADPAWSSTAASLNTAAANLAQTTNNLVDYGNTLRDTSRQNWAEVYKQLSMVALGSGSLLENSRLANQRANSAMAVLLARDCYRQATEAYLLRSTIGIESEITGLRNRMQKEPCAEPQSTAQR